MHARVRRPSLVLLSVFAGTICFGAPAGAAQLKVAVVDVQRAMRGTPHYKTAEEKLEKERANRQAALEARKKLLQERKEKLDAQKAVSDPASLAPQVEEFQREAQKLAQAFMQDQQDLTKMEKRLSEQMVGRIEIVVRELALETDRTFVFDTGAEDSPNVLYMATGIDITDEVISRYLDRFKDKPLNMN